MDANGARKNVIVGGDVRELTRIALFVALLTVSSYISLPLPFSPVPVTAQTMVLNLIALSLTPKQVFKTVGIYILAGAAGLPLFAMGASGPGVLVGPGGGYIWGFLASAIVISVLKRTWGEKGGLIRNFLAALAGIPIVYLFGVTQMALVLSLDLPRALALGALPFIPGDIFKCAAAAFLALAAERVRKR